MIAFATSARRAITDETRKPVVMARWRAGGDQAVTLVNSRIAMRCRVRCTGSRKSHGMDGPSRKWIRRWSTIAPGTSLGSGNLWSCWNSFNIVSRLRREEGRRAFRIVNSISSSVGVKCSAKYSVSIDAERRGKIVFSKRDKDPLLWEGEASGKNVLQASTEGKQVGKRTIRPQ
jgi:hypothetical protein